MTVSASTTLDPPGERRRGTSILLALGAFTMLAVGAVGLAARAAVPSAVHAAISSQPGWLQFAEAFVISELAGYAAHRAAHAVPFLWRFHKVHHAIAELDWLAAGHLHPVDQAIQRSCVVLPLFVLGFSKATFGFLPSPRSRPS